MAWDHTSASGPPEALVLSDDSGGGDSSSRGKPVNPTGGGPGPSTSLNSGVRTRL